MEKVHFTEEKATMLATLYGRALDSRSDRPVLADHTADEAVRRIDYDFGKLGVNESLAMAVVLRAKPIDTWAAAFLMANPDAVVLHLGCGMDSRPFRLAPPPSVTWYDVDQAEVIALRERVYDPRPGCHLIGTDVTDLGWLDQVPGDRPTLVVAEGLTMYLTEQRGTELLQAMIAKFPRGEMIFDLYSRLGIRLQKLNPVVRKAGATLHWGVDDPRELERYGLELITALDVASAYPEEELDRLSAGMRVQLKIAKMIPPFRRMGHICHYKYGQKLA